MDHGSFIVHTCDDDGRCAHPNMTASLELFGPGQAFTVLNALVEIGALELLPPPPHLVDPATLTFGARGFSAFLGEQQQYLLGQGSWSFTGGTFDILSNGPGSPPTGTLTVVTNGTWSGTATLTDVYYPDPFPRIVDGVVVFDDFQVAYHRVDVDYRLIANPEPATWLLLGSGLVGLVLWKRKQTAYKRQGRNWGSNASDS